MREFTVPQIAKLAIGLTTAVLVAANLGFSPVAAADPTIPLDPGQLPGLDAMQMLGPVVQQAAGNPSSAQSLLLAAASQLAGGATTPGGSAALAEQVTKFVQEGGAAGPSAALPSATPPVAQATGVAHGTTPLLTPGTGNGPVPLPEHLSAGGDPTAVFGTEAHLPTGIDPTHAAGPAPGALPEVPSPVTVVNPAAPPSATAAGNSINIANPAPAPAAAPNYDPATPPTQDFMYPSISNGCLKDGGNVIATAISVAGPAKIPTPGPTSGQTAYVFTAVGTPAPAAEQKLPLNVTWVNLTTGKSGSATLKPNPEMNAAGPTTLMAIADTGSGSIMSTIFGQVTTADKQCTFMPTIGSTVVP
ncbi:Rv1157c family protein [Mycolicibacterium sp. Dal123E01]|uniref:Rv1157c family protein n=1 Tax=Mycolicibacterium sp. Dal123E01 TaxID=3457578 RepID=UPI00403E9EB7